MKQIKTNKSLIVGMVLSLSLFPFSSHSQTPEAVCNALTEISSDIQSQLPISIDYVTDLVGHSAIRAGNICIMQYSYVIKTDVFLSDMAKENNLSLEANLEWLHSSEGQAYLKETFQDAAHDAQVNYMSEISKYKNIKVLYSHSFDLYRLPTIVSVVLDTTK